MGSKNIKKTLKYCCHTYTEGTCKLTQKNPFVEPTQAIILLIMEKQFKNKISVTHSIFLMFQILFYVHQYISVVDISSPFFFAETARKLSVACSLITQGSMRLDSNASAKVGKEHQSRATIQSSDNSEDFYVDKPGKVL